MRSLPIGEVMLKITFKGKPAECADGKTRVKVPSLKRSHWVNIGEFRNDKNSGSFANSDLAEGIINKAVNIGLTYSLIEESELTIVKAGFLNTYELDITNMVDMFLKKTR